MAIGFVGVEAERIVRERAGGRCERCGMGNSRTVDGNSTLQFHHKHGLSHQEPEDLELLCVGCHNNTHRKANREKRPVGRPKKGTPLAVRFTAATYLTKEEDDALEAACFAAGYSRSEVLRQALRIHLGLEKELDN